MDGIIVINKSKGCTSHDIVYQVKKIFGVKVGHTGTLDPNATGVLPILIGKGTELSQFLICHDKKYIATLKLGIKTDTADSEGEIIERKYIDETKVNETNIIKVLQSMIGKQKQIPPIYSAIKINGKKLYEYARKGQYVDIPSREIEIYDLKLIDFNKDENTIKYEISCSKGTYVRTVCEQIAEKLNTVGYMQDLQRTVVGDFKIENAITRQELKDGYNEWKYNKDECNKDECDKGDCNKEEKNKENFFNDKLITIESFFRDTEKISLDDDKLKLFLNGVFIKNILKDGLVRVYDKNNVFIGIGINSKSNLKRKIIL